MAGFPCYVGMMQRQLTCAHACMYHSELHCRSGPGALCTCPAAVHRKLSTCLRGHLPTYPPHAQTCRGSLSNLVPCEVLPLRVRPPGQALNAALNAGTMCAGATAWWGVLGRRCPCYARSSALGSVHLWQRTLCVLWCRTRSLTGTP